MKKRTKDEETLFLIGNGVVVFVSNAERNTYFAPGGVSS